MTTRSPAATLGMAPGRRQNRPEAVAAFELALRVRPFDPAVRCGLAEAYSTGHRPPAARERRACAS